MTHVPPTVPPGRRSADEQHRLDAAIRDLFDRQISFNQHLGLQVADLHPGVVTMRFTMRPEMIGHHLHGRLHGGVISAVLDAAGGLACLWGVFEKHPVEPADQVIGRFARLGTVDLRIDYLSPGLGQTFTVSARLSRLGGRLAATRMELHNELGVLIATGAAAYIVS